MDTHKFISDSFIIPFTASQAAWYSQTMKQSKTFSFTLLSPASVHLQLNVQSFIHRAILDKWNDEYSGWEAAWLI